MASYAVAEEGSLPPERINNLSPDRSRPAQCERSDANRRASASDVIEVIDVTDFDENC
jgi:hypothetical protein